MNKNLHELQILVIMNVHYQTVPLANRVAISYTFPFCCKLLNSFFAGFISFWIFVENILKFISFLLTFLFHVPLVLQWFSIHVPLIKRKNSPHSYRMLRSYTFSPILFHRKMWIYHKVETAVHFSPTLNPTQNTWPYTDIKQTWKLI